MPSTTRLVLLLHYTINKEYIAITYCENKSKPQLKCKGRCHLNKQIEKTEKKEIPFSCNVKDTQPFAPPRLEPMFFSVPCLNLSNRPFPAIGLPDPHFSIAVPPPRPA